MLDFEKGFTPNIQKKNKKTEEAGKKLLDFENALVPQYENKAAALIDNRLSFLSDSNDKFLNNYNSRFFNESGKFKSDSYRGDSKQWLDAAKEQYTYFNSEADFIENVIKQNEKSLDKSYVSDVRTYLSKGRKNVSSMLDVSSADDKYYSQFKNENAWRYNYNNEIFGEKYNGANYDTVKKALESTKDENERQWLTENEKFFMGSQDAQKKIDEIKNKINELNSETKNETVNRIAGSPSEGFLDNNFVIQDGQSASSKSDIRKLREEIKSLEGVRDRKKDEEERQKLQSQFEGLEKNSDFTELSSYDSTVDDPVYIFINTGNASPEARDTYISSGLNILTPEQKDKYNYIYKKQGKDKAGEYINSLSEDIAERRAENEKTAIEEMVNSNGFFGNAALSLVSVPMNILGAPVAATADLISMAAGKYNPNISASSAFNVAGNIRSAVSQKIADNTNAEIAGQKIWAQAYNGIMSSLDSVVGGTVLGNLYTLTMGMGAASQRAKELYDKGASDKQIFFGSVLSGIAEALFEKFSLDRILKAKDATSLGKLIYNFLIAQGFVENSEELATATANFFIDEGVMGESSERNTLVKKYMNEDGLSKKKAERKARDDLIENAVWSGALGAFSGMLTGGIFGGGKAIKTASKGASIKRNGNVKNLVTDALNLPENSNAYKLAGEITKNSSSLRVGSLYEATVNEQIKTAFNGKSTESIKKSLLDNGVGDTEASEYAAIIKRAADGKSITEKEYQKLITDDNVYGTFRKAVAENVVSRTEGLEKASKTAELTKSTKKSLKEKIAFIKQMKESFAEEEIKKALAGKTDESKIKSSASFLLKLLNGEKLTKNETRTLVHDEVLMKTAVSLADSKTAEIFAKDDVKASQVESGAESTESGAESTESGTKAQTDDIDELDISADGKTVLTSTGEEIQVEKITGLDARGNMRVETSDGKEAFTKDISFPDEGIAAVVYTISQTAATPEGATNMLKAYTPGNNPVNSGKLYATGIRLAFNDGFSRRGMKTAEYYGLSEEQAKTAYNAGKDGAKQRDTERKSKAENGKNGKITAVSNPNELITFVDSESAMVDTDYMDGEELSREQAAEMERKSTAVDFVRELHNAGLKIPVAFFSSYIDESGKRVYRDRKGTLKNAPNGVFYGGKIWIDLNAGDNGQGLALHALAHELTHAIREASPGDFNALADFLMEEYGEKRFESLVDNMFERLKNDPSYKGLRESEIYDLAFEDVVCQSMETMFTDTNAPEKLMKLRNEDPGLFERIKQTILRIIDRIKKAYAGIKPDTDAARLFQKTVKELDKAEDLFVKGLNNLFENGVSGDEVEKFSLKGINKDGIEVYETSEDTKNLPWEERKRRYFELINNVFKRRTARFKRNGHIYYALFDEKSADKMMYGEKGFSYKGKKAFKKIGSEGDIFDLVENASYSKSTPDDKGHKLTDGYTDYFDYFYKTVQIDNRVFDVYIDVKRKYKSNDGFVYTIKIFDNKKIKASPVKTEKQSSIGQAKPSINSISETDTKSQEETENFSEIPKNSSRYTLSEAARLSDELQKRETERLEKDLKRLRSLNSLVKNTFKYGKIRQRSLENAASVIMKAAGVKTGKDKVVSALYRVYRELLTNNKITADEVSEMCLKAAGEILDLRTDRPGRPGEIQTALNGIRTQPVSLTEVQKQELKNTYGSEWRQKLFSRINIRNDGMSLEEAWQSWSEEYPGVFDKDINEASMPERIIELYGMSNSEEIAALIDSARLPLANEIYDKYWSLVTLDTYADNVQKEVNELKKTHRENMKKLRDEQDERIKKVREEVRNEKKRAIELQKDRNKQALKDIRDEYDRKREIASERHAKSQLRGMLIRQLDRVNASLNRRKKNNVKEELRPLIEQLSRTIDVLLTQEKSDDELILDMDMDRGLEFATNKEINKMKKYRELLSERNDIMTQIDNGVSIDELDKLYEKLDKQDYKLQTLHGQLSDVLSRLRRIDNAQRVTDTYSALAKEYQKLKDSDTEYIRKAYNGAVYDRIVANINDNSLKGVIVKDMTAAQARELYDIATAVMTTVEKSNEFFANNLNAEVDVYTGKVMRETEGKNARTYGKLTPVIKKFGMFNLKPVYFFRMLGSESLQALYDNINRGQEKWVVNINKAKAYSDAIKKKYGYKDWDFKKKYDFTGRNGNTCKLTLEQLMSLYAYTLRDQSREHLTVGGFCFKGGIREEKTKTKITYTVADGQTYNLGADEMLNAANMLTEEQREYVKEMIKYLSTDMANLGNAVSMKMYGTMLFREKTYFPIKTAENYRHFDLEKGESEIQLKNNGMTKELKPKAHNPIVLDDFSQTWGGHVNTMCSYNAFVLPLEDFKKVYGSFSVTEGDSSSVRTRLGERYGNQALQYINTLLQNINGGNIAGSSGASEDILNKTLSKFKKGAVFGSLSVAIQQPSAIMRAMAYIDPKYFVNFKQFNWKQHNEEWEQLKKYAPVAAIKEMGFFDTGSALSAVEYLNKTEYEGIREKAFAAITDGDYRDEILSWLPSMMDELTWVSIWEACKNEAKAKGFDGEKRLESAGKKFTEVIELTQVYDSIFSRSLNMSDKSLFSKTVTAFMAEPTTTINMTFDALLQMKRGGKKGVKFGARAFSAIAANVIFNTILKAFVTQGWDDDEDKSLIEKLVGRAVPDLIDGLNPFSLIPICRDIVSLIQGYELERPDMAVISDLINAIRLLFDDNKTAKIKVRTVLGAVGNCFGLPVKNMWRDFEGVINIFETVKNNGILPQDKGKIKTSLKEGLEQSFTFGSYSQRSKIFKALLSGDEKRIDKVKGDYDDEEEFQEAARATVSERYKNGIIKPEQAVSFYMKYGGLKRDEAENKIRAADFKKETKTSLKESQRIKYLDTMQKAGIKLETYEDFCKQKSKVEGKDEDGDGKTDNGTKKEAMLKLIDSLKLTKEQKDILYIDCGYSEKEIRKVPWK